MNRRKPLFWGMVAFMLLLAGGLPQIEFSDDFLKYFDRSFIVRTDSDFVIENLTGLDVIEHSLDSGQEGGIATPDYLAKVEEFARWYRQQPEVTHVNSIGDIMKRLNYNMHGDDPAYYKIPENRELAAQYLLLYEMSLPYGLDLNSQINLDKSASRFTVLLRESSTAEQLELEQKGNAWLEANFSESRSSAATGLTLIWAHISRRNIESLLTSAAVALILISAILIFAFRSLKIGLISLLPNLLPALMAFGLWGLLVGRVNLGVSVVVAMSLGIVVDDTVHFLSKYLRARRKKNLSASQAVLYSFTTVGMAIITTSIVLFAGFMVLTLSGFGMNSAMGLLTAIAIGFALLADFMFLPPLLMKTGEIGA